MASSVEEIDRQHLESLALLSSPNVPPPISGEISLHLHKRCPMADNTTIQELLTEHLQSPTENTQKCMEDNRKVCCSTRGIVNVSDLRKLIEKGHNVYVMKKVEEIRNGESTNKKNMNYERTNGEDGGETLGDTMWDDSFAKIHNVLVKRPSHDEWGIKKIVLIFCDDFLQNIYEMPYWTFPTPQTTIPHPDDPTKTINFKDAIMPILATLGLDTPEGQTRIVRMLLANMPPGVTIPIHHDTGSWVPNSHRVHCPIITDPTKVIFRVGPSKDHMERVDCTEGRVFEMNNQAKHTVSNHWSEYRVHLILDYVDDVKLIKRRIKLQPGEELIQTRRSIDRKSEFGTTQTPNFVILGAQKAGTTSIYEYLNQHPLVVKAKRRETHFFDWRFPASLKTTKALTEKFMTYFLADELKSHPSCITGDSTPSYLLHSNVVIPRMKQVTPWIKMIVIMRDPVARCLSHYAMVNSKDGTDEQKKIRGVAWKNKTFETVINEEIADLKRYGVIPKVGEEEKFYGSEKENAAFKRYLEEIPMGTGSHSLLARGMYELQMRPWMKAFPEKDKILVLKMEQFKLENGTQNVMSRVFSHLGLPDFKLKDENAKNSREYKEMKPETREKLRKFYEPYDKRVFEMMGWEKW